MKRPMREIATSYSFPSRRSLLKLATVSLSAVPFGPGWCAANRQVVAPEAFGAKGDGRSDDTDAFVELSAFLTRTGGGVVELRRNAVYRVGRQRRARSTYLVGLPILSVSNVPHFEVRMNGATLKFRDGLKFGSFDPSTGQPRRVEAPHLVASDRADIGVAIHAENVGAFLVSSGTIDCNSNNAVRGGVWGDTGIQCIHTGVMAQSCDLVEWTDLEIRNSCLDGLSYSFPGLTRQATPRPLTVRDVRISNVARNCVSLIGTNQALFDNCRFEKAGMAPNRAGQFGSPPSSCFDIEAEEAECNNIVLRRSRMISGVGTLTAFVTDSGPVSDVLVDDCDLVGAVWTSKPRTTFRNCRIRGGFAKLSGGHRNPAANSRLIDCDISDSTDEFGLTTIRPHAIDLEGAGPGVSIQGSTIRVSKSRLNLRGGVLNDVDILFSTGRDKIDNRDYAIVADGAVFSDVRIIEQIGVANRPQDAYFVTLPRSAQRSSIASRSGKLMWRNWSPGAGGHTGTLTILP